MGWLVGRERGLGAGGLQRSNRSRLKRLDWVCSSQQGDRRQGEGERRPQAGPDVLLQRQTPTVAAAVPEEEAEETVEAEATPVPSAAVDKLRTTSVSSSVQRLAMLQQRRSHRARRLNQLQNLNSRAVPTAREQRSGITNARTKLWPTESSSRPTASQLTARPRA